MMMKHEEKDLVTLAISRLLSTVDTCEPGTSLPRCAILLFLILSASFFFRELLVSLHSVLGGPLLFSALHLIDKGAVKVLVGRISGKKVVQVQVNWTKVFGG